MLPITARQVVVSATDYTEVNLRLFAVASETKKTRRWSAVVLAVGIIGMGLNLLEHGPRLTGNLLFLGVLTVLSSSYLFFGQRWLRKHLAASYEKNALPVKYPTDYTITADKIRGQNELHDSTSAWPASRRADTIYPWLLLYLTEKNCLWIDLRKLQAPATAADLYRLLAEYNTPLRELSPV